MATKKPVAPTAPAPGTTKPRARKATAAAKPSAPTPPAAPVAEPAAPESVKPLYAYIGAGDLALARVRALSDAARAGTLPEAVRTLPTQLRALQDSFQEQVHERYVELAARGEKVVSGIRTQGATEQAEKAARSTLAQVKGVRTTAERAAQQTLSQAKAARTTARKTVGAAVDAVVSAADKIG
jgi:hypothetical protein